MKIRLKTKNIFPWVLALAATLVLACGGDDKKEPSPLNPVETEGRTYQQAVTLPAQGADQTIVLSDLTAAVKDIEYDASWLTVIKQTYTAASPKLCLTATDNVKDGASTDARRCAVTVTANSGDRVLLSVTQEGSERKTGIEDSHDMPTDQPAYSRRQW